MKNIMKICKAILLSFVLFNVVSCSEGGSVMNIDSEINSSSIETSVSSIESFVSSVESKSTISSEEKIYNINEVLEMCAEHVEPNTYGSYVCIEGVCDFEFVIGMTIKGELAKSYYAEPREDIWFEDENYYRFMTEKYYLNDNQYIALKFISSEKQDIKTTDIITLKVTGIKVLSQKICFTYELINIER